MFLWALIGIGGALGAISRYAVDSAVNGLFGSTVLGTFAANISGSFLLGLLASAAAGRMGLPEEVRAFAAVGFLGSYTTFSTLTVASVQLAYDGDWLRALANIVGSILVGIAAALCGLLLGRALIL